IARCGIHRQTALTIKRSCLPPHQRQPQRHSPTQGRSRPYSQRTTIMMNEVKIALVGNPNVGKSTLFNKLTGLRQRTGNYPGITVAEKTGSVTDRATRYRVIDLPGAYGLHPSSLDEQVVYNVLADKENPNHPELTLVIGDPFNLNRAVFLYHQIRDM